MGDRHERAVAIVGIAGILPDAPDAASFWRNLCAGRYSISEVPPERWSVADYYDPDPAAPDKTYSKIGAWVRGFQFDWKRFHVPPRVVAAMDEGQQWAVALAADALADYGHPGRPLDLERTGVVLGAAMGGELHYLTTLRIQFPEFARALAEVDGFRGLPDDLRGAILARWHEAVARRFPAITEDTMPGELPNIISGRVANLLDLHGPNFVTDAACASSCAALDAAVELLVDRHCDAVISGGVDRNMGVNSFVKFCKIGALSATGTRPFGEGADGFVMGEGGAAFLLKRLADAERDSDRIYAVVRGVGGASDGKGKGITAPNPAGQRLAIRRAWEDAGLLPATASLIEAHGTSTKVGDVVEVESLAAVFEGTETGSIALGSVKSNIGHLKAGAGAAGLLKATLSLHHKLQPPSLNCERPNPALDFGRSPFTLVHEPREWKKANGHPRRAGVSAYGFGGTNFHVVLEEHVPGALTGNGRRSTVAVGEVPGGPAPASAAKAPLRGIAALGAPDPAGLGKALDRLLERARQGSVPAVTAPDPAALSGSERLVLDFGSPAELVDRLGAARKAMALDTPAAWRTLQGQGVFRGSGKRPGKLAFLFPGQGSQYVNMGRELLGEPVVSATFAEADRVLEPLLGHPLTRHLFADVSDPQAREQAEQALRQTAVTQPAVLSLDAALAGLLTEYGIVPDVVMGHSLGEYAALVTAGVLPFADALEAAAARGREMTRVSVADCGWMAAVMAPPGVVEEVLADVEGYVVPANLNSRKQCVVGGASEAVARAMLAFKARGIEAQRLPVSHAFHTRIVAPAAEPLRQVLNRLRFSPPRLPVVANVTGGLYPTTVEEIKDLLVRQIASPVQWVKGLEELFASGVRVFVEVGPKRALRGFVEDVLGERGVVALHTNHPRPGGLAAFNHALCGLLAAGFGARQEAPIPVSTLAAAAVPQPSQEVSAVITETHAKEAPLEALTQLLAEAVRRAVPASLDRAAHDRNETPTGSIVISGTGLGLPGAEKAVMDPENAQRILRGEQFVDLVPERYRQRVADKHVTRVVKGEDGSGRFETIEDTADVIKLAGRPGSFDLAAEYGVSEKLVEALDVTTQLAMAAGLDALREAGIPLVQTWRKTTTGRYLPDRVLLPEAMRDETGVVFASAFPGYDRFADEARRYYTSEGRRERRRELLDLRRYTEDAATLSEIQRRISELDELLEREPYEFDRRFLLRILPMGHSQFAEHVGARGPNAHVNAACAGTAAGIALAEDWIRSGRCRRVIVLGADDVTGPNLFEWIGAGFLATGAAAIDDKVEEAALPFDRRRHGALLGMGACALVMESQDAVEERGMRGIVELLATETRNSAFHATRLDVDHIAAVMDSLVTSAERRFGLSRHAMAPETVFVSHETFTPARGGSASAEVAALRRTFGAGAAEIVVSNTKGFTGHPMGVGIEDVIGVKILEHGIVPPVPNFKEADPELGELNLSRGGRYPVKYAIHLAAGFGSQIAFTLTRRIPGGLDRIDSRPAYERWLCDVSGYDRAETEVVKRVLRIASEGAPPRSPVPSRWTWGLGPSHRAPSPGDGMGALQGPAHLVLPVAPPRVTETAPPVQPPTPRVAPAEPAPVPAPAPSPAPVASADDVTAKVMAIVAEKTGYPPEMLDPDLDLEADLGVDTVKQAETFAAVRETYGIPRQESLKLRDFPTLKHVVKFVLDHRPDLIPAVPSLPSSAPPPVPESKARPRPIPSPIEDADRFPARIPVACLRPPLALCKPTEVRLQAGARVVIGADRGGVAGALAERLAAQGAVPLTLDVALPADVLVEQLRSWQAEGAVAGVFWLPALDVEPALGDMDLAAFREATRQRVKSLYSAMRALYDAVATAGSFLIAATRMGGLHGQGPEGATAPLGGGVAGFAKAYKKERPEALVKAVDFAVADAPGAIAEALLSEAAADPGVVEVGLHDGLRFTLDLVERPHAGNGAGLALGPDTVFLVTGAAGGITSAIVADLAAASGGTFYLLDLAPEPRRDDPLAGLFRADRERLKATLIEEARGRGERPTPVQIDKRLLAVERDDAALRAIEAVEASGGAACWRPVDLLDAGAVARVVGEVRERHGRLDVLVHAGGIEISRRLPEKQPAEFERVFDVKADGFFNLLRACADMPLGATVAFGSVAGRFGNAGQADYSAANALLASLSAYLRAARPETRAITIDWTAWADIGMATRGSIPALMLQAGIETLPPQVGIPTVRRELVRGHAPGEVVVAGSLGAMAPELDVTGGLDAEATTRALATRRLPLVMLGSAKAATVHGGLVVETTLDPRRQPFLNDHQMEGTPVLPGAMGTEAFAELGRLLAPDLRVAAIEDEEFLTPFKFHRQQPATMRLCAAAHPNGGAGELLVDVELRSLIQPKPDLAPQEKLNFKARLFMARNGEASPTVEFQEPAPESLAIGPEAIYSVFFHGPAYRVLDRVGIDGARAIGRMAEALPPDTAPADAEHVTEPRLLELCFQTAGVWEIASLGTMGLPTALRRVRFHRPAAEAAGQRLYALVDAKEGGQTFDGRVVDSDGRVYVELEGYRTVTLPGARSFAS